jgi:hypothetical protein
LSSSLVEIILVRDCNTKGITKCVNTGKEVILDVLDLLLGGGGGDWRAGPIGGSGRAPRSSPFYMLLSLLPCIDSPSGPAVPHPQPG